MLGLYGRPLLNEPIKAWRYGPVIAELYDEVKKYRSEPVPDNLSTAKVVFDDEETDLMNQVVDIYSNYSGIELSSITHEKGTPWHQAWHGGKRFSDIPNDIIEDHFRELAEEPAAQQEE